MRNTMLLAAFAVAAILPVASPAAVVDASLIPDGTYIVKVQRVVDASHIQVSLTHSGLESTLASTGSAHFDAVKASDTLKVSIVKGKVPVFTEQ